MNIVVVLASVEFDFKLLDCLSSFMELEYGLFRTHIVEWVGYQELLSERIVGCFG